MADRVIACGAGFAGDRIDPAVSLAASGMVDAIGLECLAERTLVPGLRSRRLDPDAGADPRLRRRLGHLLPVAKGNGCRVTSNLGAANPAAAARQVAALAKELGLHGLRCAAVLGDDVLALQDRVDWQQSFSGTLLGAHAYLGADAIAPAIEGDADVVITGRSTDSALFSAEVLPILVDDGDALAGATAVGHVLECSGQMTGGNFELPDGRSLSAVEFADLGFPIATVDSHGNAVFSLLPGKPGRIDRLTCTLQLLYEVHDPSAYITPDTILDMTGVRFEEIAPNQVRMSGARSRGRPDTLKVSGFVEEPGVIADIEIGYAGTYALQRGEVAADTLRIRLSEFPPDDIRIDLVGIDSTLGASSLAPPNRVPEVRMHVSARCPDAEVAQMVEDEVYALTLSGPAGGGSVRSERRPCLAIVDGYIDRREVTTSINWEVVS